jgi:hypothetical protein
MANCQIGLIAVVFGCWRLATIRKSQGIKYIEYFLSTRARHPGTHSRQLAGYIFGAAHRARAQGGFMQPIGAVSAIRTTIAP